MKGLNVLKTPLILCSLCCAALLSAEQSPSVAFLSELKEAQFEQEAKKVEYESDKLQRSILEPIWLRYNMTKSNPSDVEQTAQSASVTIDQPIFQSGGMLYALKYAESTRSYGHDSIALQRKKMIKEAVSLLMQIRQAELMLRKQELLIANAAMNVEQKSEQYRSGQLDSTFLDQAIIEQNSLKQASFDIQTNLKILVSTFKTMSDADYKSVPLPTLALAKQDDFIESNLEVRQLQSQREQQRHFKGVTVAKYLPKVNLTAGYFWDSQENLVFGGGSSGIPPMSYEQDYYSYGLKVSMPLNVNTFNDIEVTQAEYLKTSLMLTDKKREQIALYERVMHNIENLENKIALAESNRRLYEKLAQESRLLYEAGYKTAYDLQTLENSAKIQRAEVDILTLDRQRELLNLYEKSADDL